MPAAAEFIMQERDGVFYVKKRRATSYRRHLEASRGRGIRRILPRAHPGDRRAPRAGAGARGVRHPRGVELRGARGVAEGRARLMQLMPATAAQVGVRDVFDVRENIDAGFRHLRYLLDLYRGNVPFALAAYNAGVDAVARYSGIPPYAETQVYVSRILRLLQEAGIPTKMDDAVSTGAAAVSRTLYCYEAPDGRVVYSNLPIDRLSEAARAMLRGR